MDKSYFDRFFPRYNKLIGERSLCILILTLICFPFLYLSKRHSFLIAFPSMVVMIVLILSLSFYLFNYEMLWFEPFALVALLVAHFIASMICRYVAGHREKQKIQEMFGSCVAKDVADGMVNGEIEVSDKATTKSLTVLFSDIRGFTPMTEKLGDPEKTREILKIYFDRMIGVVQSEYGNHRQADG